MSQKYDVLIWGCTGFTGQLVTRYFKNNVGDTLRWAIGGRSQEKCEQVAEELGLTDIDILIGSNFEQDEIDAVVSQTRVLINMTGPYFILSKNVVNACVRFGVHYVDITGEVSYMSENIELYHETAEKDGTLIVSACGYDSIPFDIGTFVTVREIEKRGGKCASVRSNVLKMKGEASGGTISTMINEITQPKEVRKRAYGTYSMNPPQNRTGSDKDIFLPNKHPIFGWTLPHLMATPNSRVVRRSSAILGYSDDFRYGETVTFSYVMAIMIAIMGIIVVLLQFSFLKKRIKKWVPQPGTGPSDEAQEAGYAIIGFVGTPEDNPEDIVKVQMNINGDPGYSQTALMISESALCLALQRDELAAGGVLTPASALGETLVQRLKNAGFIIRVVDDFNTERITN